MTPGIESAIAAWDSQTAIIEAAPHLEPAGAHAALAGVPAERERLDGLPIDDEDRALINAAIDRFAAAVTAKAGN